MLRPLCFGLKQAISHQTSKAPGLLSVLRFRSEYEQSASHDLQAAMTNYNPEPALYNENEVREFLSSFGGGDINLVMDSQKGEATLTLDYPQKRNAMTGLMMVKLSEALKKLEKWKEGTSLFVVGNGEHFCSGGELEFMNKIADPISGAKMSIYMQTVMARLHRLPLISVAVLKGYVLGGGAEFAMACDFRVAHPNASIGFVQSRLGITPGWGGGTHLTRQVGPRIALGLLAAANVHTAEECHQLGVIDGILKGDDVFIESVDWLHNLIGKSTPQAVVAAKCIVRQAIECEYSEAMNRERDMFVRLWGSKEHLMKNEKKMKHNSSPKDSSDIIQ